MNDNIMEIGLIQLLTAYIFVVLLLIILKFRDISKEKQVVLATLRMTIQLVIAGYILDFIFQSDNSLFTILLIVVMEVFAVSNIYKRTNVELNNDIKKVIFFSMVTGTIVSLLYFLFIVIRIEPWYDSRYFITLGGMIIGNSMTGISLGVNNLLDGMATKKDMVEAALMLGATPKMASKDIVNNAFDSAILPTINSMVGMGIVFLPGMMTGQILSGASPIIAIKYQIAIMLGILGSVSLTVILFLQLGYKTFFTAKAQLKD